MSSVDNGGRKRRDLRIFEEIHTSCGRKAGELAAELGITTARVYQVYWEQCVIAGVLPYNVDQFPLTQEGKARLHRFQELRKRTEERVCGVDHWYGIKRAVVDRLVSAGVKSAERLLEMSEQEVLELNGIGAKSLGSIREALSSRNVALSSELNLGAVDNGGKRYRAMGLVSVGSRGRVGEDVAIPGQSAMVWGCNCPKCGMELIIVAGLAIPKQKWAQEGEQ